MRAFGLAFLVLVAAPAAAQGVQLTSSVPESAEAASALELAKLASPAEAVLDQEIASARSGFFGAIETDPDFLALEQEYPGIGKALWDAIEPEARRVAVESAPRLWEKLVQIYRSRLTLTEMRALIAFYESPTGQKGIRTMYASADLTPMMKEAIDNPDGKISAESLAAGQRAARAKAVDGMGPEDEPALMALSRAMPMAKLLAVGQEVQKATLDFLNEVDPESEARVEALVTETMDRYMAKGAK